MMMWVPVNIEVLLRVARRVREVREHAAAQRVPSISRDVQDRLRRRDELLRAFLDSPEWEAILGVAHDIYGDGTTAVGYPDVFVNPKSLETAHGWDVRGSASCWRVAVDVGPTITLVLLTEGPFGPGRRVLAVGEGLQAVAEALQPEDLGVGVAVLLDVTQALEDGNLGTLLRERPWRDARRALGLP